MWSSLLGRKKESPRPVRPTGPTKTQQALGPPITEEESKANLSELERKLNREMKCPAGMNQVFIRSLVTVSGPSRPRIALKCHLRRDIGQSPDVFYEHIRDVCCSAPESCEAYRRFKDRLVPT
jgi:hypothetical protein